MLVHSLHPFLKCVFLWVGCGGDENVKKKTRSLGNWKATVSLTFFTLIRPVKIKFETVQLRNAFSDLTVLLELCDLQHNPQLVYSDMEYLLSCKGEWNCSQTSLKLSFLKLSMNDCGVRWFFFFFFLSSWYKFITVLCLEPEFMGAEKCIFPIVRVGYLSRLWIYWILGFVEILSTGWLNWDSVFFQRGCLAQPLFII